MNTRKLLSYLIGSILIVSFSAACNLLQPRATPTPVPTATPSLGKIKGVLLVSGRQSVQDTSLGLWITEGTGEWKKMEDAHIETKPDSDGAFLFEDVPPGTYLLAAKFGGSSSQAPDFMKSDDGLIAIEVAAGQTVDLGTIPVTGQ